MKEIGATIIVFALAALGFMFIYFGVDDKDPVCIILGAAVLGGLLLIAGA